MLGWYITVNAKITLFKRKHHINNKVKNVFQECQKEYDSSKKKKHFSTCRKMLLLDYSYFRKKLCEPWIKLKNYQQVLQPRAHENKAAAILRKCTINKKYLHSSVSLPWKGNKWQRGDWKYQLINSTILKRFYQMLLGCKNTISPNIMFTISIDK